MDSERRGRAESYSQR